MDSLKKEFELVLKNENDILEELSSKQKVLRKVLTEKNWDSLLELMSDINSLSGSFQKFDSRRDEIQNQLEKADIDSFNDALICLREKLLRCKIENKVISTYVNTTRQFIASVIQEAIPQVGNRNYTSKGEITKPHAASVLFDIQG